VTIKTKRYNINSRDVQRKNVVNNVDIQVYRHHEKWPVQKQTHRTAQKHAEHQDASYKDINNVYPQYTMCTVSPPSSRELLHVIYD